MPPPNRSLLGALRHVPTDGCVLHPGVLKCVRGCRTTRLIRDIFQISNPTAHIKCNCPVCQFVDVGTLWPGEAMRGLALHLLRHVCVVSFLEAMRTTTLRQMRAERQAACCFPIG